MSSYRATNILVIGATGNIGQYITEGILNARSIFNRIAILTSQGTVDTKNDLLGQWKERGLEVIVGDATKDEDVLNAYKDIDTVISAVGRGVIASQINMLRLAEETPSVQRFFPSEYGTDIERVTVPVIIHEPHE